MLAVSQSSSVVISVVKEEMSRQTYPCHFGGEVPTRRGRHALLKHFETTLCLEIKPGFLSTVFHDFFCLSVCFYYIYNSQDFEKYILKILRFIFYLNYFLNFIK